MADLDESAGRDDQALQAFRKAVRDLLILGFDADLLAEEVTRIWESEFTQGDDDDA